MKLSERGEDNLQDEKMKKKRVLQRKTSTTTPNPGKMQLARRKSELVERRSTF